MSRRAGALRTSLLYLVLNDIDDNRSIISRVPSGPGPIQYWSFGLLGELLREAAPLRSVTPDEALSQCDAGQELKLIITDAEGYEPDFLLRLAKKVALSPLESLIVLTGPQANGTTDDRCYNALREAFQGDAFSKRNRSSWEVSSPTRD